MIAFLTFVACLDIVWALAILTDQVPPLERDRLPPATARELHRGRRTSRAPRADITAAQRRGRR